MEKEKIIRTCYDDVYSQHAVSKRFASVLTVVKILIIMI